MILQILNAVLQYLLIHRMLYGDIANIRNEMTERNRNVESVYENARSECLGQDYNCTRRLYELMLEKRKKVTWICTVINCYLYVLNSNFIRYLIESHFKVLNWDFCLYYLLLESFNF